MKPKYEKPGLIDIAGTGAKGNPEVDCFAGSSADSACYTGTAPGSSCFPGTSATFCNEGSGYGGDKVS